MTAAVRGGENPFSKEESQEAKRSSTTQKVARIGFNWSTLAVFGTGTLTGVGLSLGLASLVLLLGSANPIFFPLGIGALICLAISTVLIVVGSCRELCRS